jgi:hypothetical protein
MIMAYFLLHNFIRIYMLINPKESTLVSLEDMSIGEDPPNGTISIVEPSNEWT